MRGYLPLHFNPIDEIVALNSWYDMQKAIDYFLEHESERKEIAERAREHTLKKHTYKHRAQEVLSIIS